MTMITEPTGITEPTTTVWVTIGGDVDERGSGLVTLCAEMARRLRRARPEIEWHISADTRYPTSTIKVEPDWPANYAEISALVGLEIDG